MTFARQVQRVRAALDHLLLNCLPAVWIIALVGAAFCTGAIVRSVLHPVHHRAGPPTLVTNCACVVYVCWAEASSLLALSAAGRRTFQRVAAWICGAGWILFLAADQYEVMHRSTLPGSVVHVLRTFRTNACWPA